MFTIVHNEPFFLPAWYRYYSSFFDQQDIYILDNDSTDGCTRGYLNVILKPSQYVFDHSWLVSVVSDFQKELLKTYDCVVFAEIDEFLLAGPAYDSNLRKLIENKNLDHITANGFDVIHGDEPPLIVDRPWLHQRQFGCHSTLYNKTLIHKSPTIWGIGFHYSEHQQQRYDQDLKLIHLHYLDRDVAWRRLNSRHSKPFSPYDLFNKLGAQNAQTEEVEYWQKWPKGTEQLPSEFITELI